jgi:CTP:phosphocholine cytidylyltransferase-like protein
MLNVLILVPEITKGMKSIGSKALLEIKKHTKVLEYQIHNIKNLELKTHITVATGFEAERIHAVLDALNINYSFNPLYKDTNQAESIRLYLEEHAPKSLLILNNGILLKNHALTKNLLSGRSKLFLLDKTKENFNLGCITTNRSAEYIFYDLPEPWTECVYLDAQALIGLNTIMQQKDISQMYLFELLNQMIADDIIIDKHYINKAKIMKINTIKDLPKAKTFI